MVAILRALRFGVATRSALRSVIALLPVVFLLQADGDLPGKQKPPMTNKTRKCHECKARVVVVQPQGARQPRCPNDPTHHLSDR